MYNFIAIKKLTNRPLKYCWDIDNPLCFNSAEIIPNLTSTLNLLETFLTYQNHKNVVHCDFKIAQWADSQKYKLKRKLISTNISFIDSNPVKKNFHYTCENSYWLLAVTDFSKDLFFHQWFTQSKSERKQVRSLTQIMN